MTTPHKATLEQWVAERMIKSPLSEDLHNNAKILDLIPLASCLLELADHLAALEAAFASHGEQISGLLDQHNVVVDNITDLQGSVNQLEVAATPSPTAKDSSVVAPDHSRSATEMVATDEELIEAFYANVRGVLATPGFRAIYDLGRHHGTQPRHEGDPTPPPAFAGGLVQEISRQLPLRPVEIRSVIRAAANWLMKTQQEAPVGSALRVRQEAAMLREEADR